MMTATSRNLELLRAGERGEGQEVYSRCVVEGVVSRRTHTLSVNHNQSGTFAFHFRPLEPRLLHESYPYLLVGSPGKFCSLPLYFPPWEWRSCGKSNQSDGQVRA